MAERPGPALRLIGMPPIRSMLLGTTLVFPLLVAGCGTDSTAERAPSAEATPSSTCSGGGEPVAAKLDLDGDGAAETVGYRAPEGPCPAMLESEVGGDHVAAEVDNDLPVAPRDLSAVRLTGHKGDLLLLTPQHPRGGFQARLYGYADGKLEELTVGGKPIFPFVATDSLSTPLTATCTDGGFAVTQGRAHQPIGVAPAWDVYRTTYTVVGNTVTKAGENGVAENVLTDELEAKYTDLVNHALFEDCVATG